MLRTVRFVVVLWVLVVLQTTVVPAVRIGGAGPDLPFVLVILAALFEGAAGGALAGFAAGLFVGLNSPQHLGVSSLVSAFVAFAVGSIGDRLVRSSAGTRFALVLGALVLRDLVLVIAMEPGETGRLLIRSVLPGALYTAVIAVPLMMLIEKAVGWREESGRARR